MLSIRCPICEKMVRLAIAGWEDFTGFLELGRSVRVGLVCTECHNDFILTLRLNVVVIEQKLINTR